MPPHESPERSAIRKTVARAAGLRAAFHRWRAAVEKVPQATELPDPVFTYAHYVEDIETRTGPQRQRFSLQQTLPWFGTLSTRGEVAAKQAETLWWRGYEKAVHRDDRSGRHHRLCPSVHP